MHARSTTIKGDPGAIEAGIMHVRDQVMPAVTGMPGCLGMSMVVDRETGRGIATTSWETEEAMVASRGSVAALRARATEIFGGADPLVEEWEVAVMHRDHPTHEGSCCRITWTHTPDVDRTIGYWRRDLLPKFESMEGFCSASFLVDRAGSRACGTLTFDSRAALEATRARAAEIREAAARDMGVQFLDVAEFDLALAHLRLPEMV
jgi:heme-degrading monooxygenase HmoA